MTKTPFGLFAPAKINLALSVVGRREDGFHLLDSLVAFAKVGDTLTFIPADEITLTIDGPKGRILSGQADNIVLKAARVLAEATGCTKGAQIKLTKRLPIASGIGGGSADAAATLKGLCRLWGISMTPRELASIGLKIGSDVPVCLVGKPARMQGVGEIVESVPALPPGWLVLVNPGIGLSTPAVFKARSGEFSPSRSLLTAPMRDVHALARALAMGSNDLTAAAIGLAPVVGEVLDAVAGSTECLLARMSGSGATCFGLYSTGDEAKRAAAGLKAAHSRWWVAAAPLL